MKYVCVVYACVCVCVCVCVQVQVQVKNFNLKRKENLFSFASFIPLSFFEFPLSRLSDYSTSLLLICISTSVPPNFLVFLYHVRRNIFRVSACRSFFFSLSLLIYLPFPSIYRSICLLLYLSSYLYFYFVYLFLSI